MAKTNYISNKKLIFRIILGLMLFSILSILLSTIYIKDVALNTLAQDDAKKTSELIFETMNTRMQEGWGKDDLNKILKKLEHIRIGLKVSSYRSPQVEKLFGIIEEDKKIVQNDPLIQNVIKTGKEEFVIEKDGSIRFLYPMKASGECIYCHLDAKIGDVNGVLDISYPPSDIKISLDMMTYYFVGFFITFILIFFYIFFFIINKKMVTPIVEFTHEIKKIADANDLTLRANLHTNIQEIRTLQDSFNYLLKTIKFYYDKLINSLYMDSLTSLPNFIKLQKDLEVVDEFSFVIVDIDKFKQINNFYGIKVADFILEELGRLLQTICALDAQVYRMNADLFGLLYSKNIEKEVVKNIIEKVHSHNFKYKFADINIRISIGYLSNNSNKIIEKTELALSEAKRTNKCFIQYDNSLELEDEYMMNMLWTQKVEEALENDNIVPYFQPMKSVKTQVIDKYETLMRLEDIDRVYTPDYFIEASQKANLYPQLTQRMIKKVFEYFIQKDTPIKFSLNFALEDIKNKETTSLLIECLKNYKYSSNVIIELLETQEISDFDALNQFINEVKVYGAKIAIDDFGSGYSNFNYILNLNIDIVKLDSSLIENIDINNEAFLVVENITKVVRALKLEVIAEKVHTQAIEDILIELDIDYLQGYHIGKPKQDIL